jgi:two-component system sensor histidine kinase DesK
VNGDRVTEPAADCGPARGESPLGGCEGEQLHPRRVLAQTLQGRPSGVRLTMAFVWLAFIIFPLINAIAAHGPALQHALVIVGAALFVSSYVMLVLTFRRRGRRRVSLLLFGVLIATSTALTVGNAAGWAFLFTYCAACAAMLLPRPYGFYGVAACSALAAGTSWLARAPGGTVVGSLASAAGIGLLMLVMRDLRVRNEELTAARAELARLAVAQERERFARDLHDLLGHSLSVIAIKAELAGRLLRDRPEEAAREVADVEEVARTALGEVRDAVSGYRLPTLEGELAGARMALSAAGIDASVEQPVVALDPAAEGVLAWAVREGATNVIRHSRARHCWVKITGGLDATTLEVVDDGAGTSGAGPRSTSVTANGGSATSNGSGHGLAGLGERVADLQGRVEAGARAEGGFRLAVTLPRQR